MVERVYQKEENLVRREWKVSQSMSVNAFEVALKKGKAIMITFRWLLS